MKFSKSTAPARRLRRPLLHYRVRGVIVRSENAAKPATQRSQAVSQWLKAQPRVHDALDYGCGKLRYAANLIARAKRVTFVDSDIQIRRHQVLLGRRSSVVTLVRRRWPSSRVLAATSFERDSRHYDLVLCANVLSAIPSRRIRMKVLRAIHARLKPKAPCLLVSQYRNSDFMAAAKRWKSEAHQDGWLLKSRRGSYFYAPLTADRLQAMARKVGLSVREKRLRDGSALVVVTR